MTFFWVFFLGVLMEIITVFLRSLSFFTPLERLADHMVLRKFVLEHYAILCTKRYQSFDGVLSCINNSFRLVP